MKRTREVHQNCVTCTKYTTKFVYKILHFSNEMYQCIIIFTGLPKNDFTRGANKTNTKTNKCGKIEIWNFYRSGNLPTSDRVWSFDRLARRFRKDKKFSHTTIKNESSSGIPEIGFDSRRCPEALMCVKQPVRFFFQIKIKYALFLLLVFYHPCMSQTACESA